MIAWNRLGIIAFTPSERENGCGCGLSCLKPLRPNGTPTFLLGAADRPSAPFFFVRASWTRWRCLSCFQRAILRSSTGLVSQLSRPSDAAICTMTAVRSEHARATAVYVLLLLLRRLFTSRNCATVIYIIHRLKA